MGARAGPEHDVGTPEVVGHFRALEHAAIGDVAGHTRRAVADDAFAGLRPHAVAADQRAAFGALAVFQRDGDAVAVILVAVDLAVVFQRDQVAALAGLQKRRVDVGAMGDGVRLAEALDEFGAERNIGDQLAGQRVAHFLRRRAMGVGEHGVLEADLFQHAENIRPKLDAGADFAEFGRLLEQAHRKTLPRQRIGRDQPADAAAGNEKWRRAAVCLAIGLAVRFGHLLFPRRNCFAAKISRRSLPGKAMKRPAGYDRRAWVETENS